MDTFYSHGKLLLTGEYVVLDGVKALAIPTKYGQFLEVNPIDKNILIWKSIDNEGNIWFEHAFNPNDTNYNNPISQRIIEIISAVKTLNSKFNPFGFEVTTTLEFPQDWGLGSSSTLINNIANWANVDAFKLLELTFGGSGYDIACAQNNTPIIYSTNNNTPDVQQVIFNPSFIDNLYFIHLNKKQNSREGIARYKQNRDNSSHTFSKINTITEQILNCTNLDEFEQLLTLHENIIANIIKLKPVKETMFHDYDGAIKSLGAWGGDFIIATGNNLDTVANYFKSKGYHTIIPYKDMII
ncbi:GYDIA family GHMP kinase [Pontimicrobium sp. IMCC45349]|uniref:GYDIA family GHMP kinase n=1 Tax=Pontimicrobium sp. IMCC45349 TaxID=3391574 RepID=UPI00399F1143